MKKEKPRFGWKLPGQSVCLCMIVKNEAPVIERCLTSVMPIISNWVIVDTGSTDGTQDVVRRFLAQVPGTLYERPWRDFAANRSEALALARGEAEYSLIIDADDALLFDNQLQIPRLVCDSYEVEIIDANIRYRRTQLVANRLPWRYEGVLHEFLTVEGAQTQEVLGGVRMRRNYDGARRRDPETYRRDARILEQALAGSPSDFLRSRYTFYLAQSYRDCGEKEKALEHYLARAEMAFWVEERYVSLYEAGKLKEILGYPLDDIVSTYLRATELSPSRAEALHDASRLCRHHNQFRRGWEIGRRAKDLTQPVGALFAQAWIYDYGALDEYSVNAYWCGEYLDSLDGSLRILEGDRIPAEQRSRIVANARYALDRLVERSGSPAPVAVPKEAGYALRAPPKARGGTEILAEGLRRRIGCAIDKVNLKLNLFDVSSLDDRPLVLWMHHDVNQVAVQWCREPSLVQRVARFVFVSEWQRERYLQAFDLPRDRCVVLKNATEAPLATRHWQREEPWRCYYASTPYRGLAVLLRSWEHIAPSNAELHVWSSMRLYGMGEQDKEYEDLFERARTLPNVFYHGWAPNEELREAVKSMHFLAYPCTFEETSCLTAIEAMAAGCRVICPTFGALPETTGGFARTYAYSSDFERHVQLFGEALVSELRAPWHGQPGLSARQQQYVREKYNWDQRAEEWRQFIDDLTGAVSGRQVEVVRQEQLPVRFSPRMKKIRSNESEYFVTEQDFIARRIQENGVWEPHLYEFARLVLAEDCNVIDMGANFGYHTLGLARLVPHGRVFAFEPLGVCFSQIQINLLINKIMNVSAFKLAASDKTGEVVSMESLEATLDANGMVNLGHTSIGGDGEPAFTARLDDMVLPRIDFVKMDIQGAEFGALNGMRATIDRDRPVLFIEIEEAHLRKLGTSSKAVIELLMSWNYTLLRIRTEWPTDHLAVPNEREEILTRCREQKAYELDVLAGSKVDLHFENAYYYRDFETH